eukprot:513324-Amorphochlora_amoeboformis.AAC.1
MVFCCLFQGSDVEHRDFDFARPAVVHDPGLRFMKFDDCSVRWSVPTVGLFLRAIVAGWTFVGAFEGISEGICDIS